MTFVILWAFEPKPSSKPEFATAYGPSGPWADLFRASTDFLGRELLKDREAPGRYLAVNRWRSQAAYQAFQDQLGREYAKLDLACERLTSKRSVPRLLRIPGLNQWNASGSPRRRA